MHHQWGMPHQTALGIRPRICTVTRRRALWLRHPVRNSWRPCPSWTNPGDFADVRDGGKGCTVRGIPYALLQYVSHQHGSIWEPQGSRTLLPHRLCEPVIDCLRNLSISALHPESSHPKGGPISRIRVGRFVFGRRRRAPPPGASRGDNNAWRVQSRPTYRVYNRQYPAPEV